MQNQRVQITFDIQNHCHVNFFYSVKKKYFWFKNRNSITWHLVLLNSTDEQARQFLVCSLCEMLSNVKSETFTLVFLRDHLVFASCMRAERTDKENTEENTSSNSPGWVCFHWTLLEYQSACSTNLNQLCSRIVFIKLNLILKLCFYLLQGIFWKFNFKQYVYLSLSLDCLTLWSFHVVITSIVKSTKTITEQCVSCQNKSVCQKLAWSCKKWKSAKTRYPPFCTKKAFS